MSPAAAAPAKRQVVLPWRVSARISLLGLRARFLRSLITTVSLALATALLAFTLAVNGPAARRLAGVEAPRPAPVQVGRADPAGQAGSDVADAGARDRWIVGLSLLVCAVGVVNAQFMAVTERFRDIGTMKCLGALDSFILRLLLLEAAMQGLVGAAAGAAAGGAAALVSLGLRFGWAALWAGLGQAGESLAGAVGLSVLVGLGLALLGVLPPALTAARLEPAQAMRAE